MLALIAIAAAALVLGTGIGLRLLIFQDREEHGRSFR